MSTTNSTMERTTLTVVIPVYNEQQSIASLVSRLNDFVNSLKSSVEVLLVDDHSTDESGSLLRNACRDYPNYRYLRLSQNCGSHAAILAGLEHATGDCAVFLASDLQDPPELIPKMLQQWQQGSHVVWAVRERREGISIREKLFAQVFYFLMNRLSEVALPPTGADFALLDRRVVTALLASSGADPSLGADIASLGFRQTEITYVKAAREFGKSSWTLRKRLKAFADAFVGHSFAPIRFMSYVGMAMSSLGLTYAVVIIALRMLASTPVEGWASLMVATLVLGGTQMMMLGVLGEYLTRTLRESRRRPRYFIEDASTFDQSNELSNQIESENVSRSPHTRVEQQLIYEKIE